MFCVYILYSKSLNLFYVGQTEDINARINEHNSGFYKNSFTAKAHDWNLYHLINCTSKTQAIKIEAHIKRMKSRKYIESLKTYPEIADKLTLLYRD